MDNEVEVSIYYRTWDNTTGLFKFRHAKQDISAEVKCIVDTGFRRVDAGGYVHYVPPGMVLEIIWKDG